MQSVSTHIHKSNDNTDADNSPLMKVCANETALLS